MTKRFGEWAYERCDDGVIHFVPVDDTGPHLVDNCTCMPETVEGIIHHNSFDGREAFETGQRLPS